jgi:IS5 family transposase
VPDHSTLSRFRSELGKQGLAEPLLAELNRQLDKRGLIVKQGTLIDAKPGRGRRSQAAQGRAGRGPQRPGRDLDGHEGRALLWL